MANAVTSWPVSVGVVEAVPRKPRRLTAAETVRVSGVSRRSNKIVFDGLMRKSRGRAPKICYACGRPTTTREHVPPECFFPPSLRSNLITVPSCPIHNNANSMDVEYVRNVLCCATNLGPNSEAVFAKMMRSIDRRPALIDTTFQDLRPIQLRGEETGAFSVELRRFNRIMSAIAQALHYRDFGEKRRYWEVFCPSFHSDESLVGQADAWEPLRRTAATLGYVYQATGCPSVFCYGRTRRTPRGCIYQFVFYDAVIVNAWPSKRQVR